MQAETLNCPMCGAAVSTDAARCLYCSARLATHQCPSCFGMMFMGSRHCPRCGARAARVEASPAATLRCPRCRIEMGSAKLGTTTLDECSQCGGLWVDVASFEEVCARREQQAAVLGAAQPAPSNAASNHAVRVRYVPCPVCQQLMNRVNFAHCSGVIVDVCKGHGTWFDRDQLSRIVEFIRGGGLEASREREKTELKEERRRLWEEQVANERNQSRLGMRLNDEHRLIGIASTRSLLKFLLD